MPIGKDETKEQYYKRMVADLGMMMKLVEKDEKKEKKNETTPRKVE